MYSVLSQDDVRIAFALSVTQDHQRNQQITFTFNAEGTRFTCSSSDWGSLGEQKKKHQDASVNTKGYGASCLGS